MALIPWEIIVARAAPFIPILKVNINKGSKIILHTAPISTDSMAVAACPWQLINMLRPKANCTNIVPIR